MPELSVVIITYNEEKNIARCLDSIQGIADDVVVVDSFSSDKTEEICKRYNVNFIQCKWEGYSTTKNFANQVAKHNWILSLDADEALSEELKSSIRQLKAGNELCTASFNRLTNYCGTWIKHAGWYPDKKIRLFDRSNTQWGGLIHEELVFQKAPTIRHLKGDCLHYSYYTIEQHIQQTEKFTNLSAADLFEKGKKATFIKLYISPIVKFIQSYIFQLGFLDGYHGFVVCRISARATYLKYYKLKQLSTK